MLGLWNLSWLDQNGQRAYPFTARATKTDQTETVRIPDSFLVGLQFSVHVSLNVQPNRFFLRELLLTPAGYQLALAYDDSDVYPLAALVSLARSSHHENDSYVLRGIDDFDDCSGHIAVGKLDEINRLPPGRYTFDPAGGELEPDCIRPMIRSIHSLTLVNGTQRSPRLYGTVELLAGRNCQLALVDGTKIRISAIAGEGLNQNCDCQPESGEPIRTIDGVSPDREGNLELVGTNCLRVEPFAGGLRLVDKCAEPCCGNTEIDELAAQIVKFGDALTTLSALADRLDSAIASMNNTIAGSDISGTSCTECAS